MELNENELHDILGLDNTRPDASNTIPVVPMPTGSNDLASGCGSGVPPCGETSLINELRVTKQRLAIATETMEGMKSEIEALRTTWSRPLKIFALGFVPSVVMAMSNIDMLKWVSNVLSMNMKVRMESRGAHFKVIKAVAGVDSVGVRTCPTFNRIEFCSLKWHHMTKIGRTGRSRAELRIHCCTLCLEALGIICGHPLFRCPWIYEETWAQFPSDDVDQHDQKD